MKQRILTLVIGSVGLLILGCQSKTPEEAEAAKYPKAAPLTAEQQAHVDQLSKQPWEQSKNQPTTAPNGQTGR